MHRSVSVVIMISLFAFLAADANAKRRKRSRKKKPQAPVTVTVKNGCKTKITLKLDEAKIPVGPGETSPARVLHLSERGAFTYSLLGSKREPAFVFFTPGGSYAVKVRNCGGGLADITTHDLSERPSGISPHAAAKVRFRASRAKGQRIPSLEYRAGQRGRFKRLSLGMTRYQDAKAGVYHYGLKLRAKPRGPVLNMLNQKVKLESGHKYLIEAGAAGRRIIIKFEDEGWAAKEK